MPQIRPIPGTGTQYEQAYAGPSDNEPFVLPAPFGASSPDGLGAYARPVSSPMYQPGQSGSGVLSGSPLVRSFQRLARHRLAKSTHDGVRGFGDATTGTAAAPVAATAALMAFVVFDMALSGVAGYFVGKAVAPSASSENKYAWWGVAAGLLGGPVGLGIEAVVALNHKGSR